MRRLAFGFLVLCAVLGGLSSAARAEEAEPTGSFADSVDLSRFRKGNSGWDTQELIASGLTALHEENIRILNKLDQIQSRLERLEKKIATSKRED